MVACVEGAMRNVRVYVFAAIALAATASVYSQEARRQWLAGDSHVHSYWSPGYDRTLVLLEPDLRRD
jgi:hypothetical protein